MGRLFGTDGVRGLANADLTPELALALGQSAARVLGTGTRPVAVVGRDPRASGELLEAAVVAGLASAGADVIRVGVLPTPAVSVLTAQLGADIGVMLSASHNPMPDNGVKIFDRTGSKLPDRVEDAITESMTQPWQRPTGAAVGRVREDHSAGERYVDHLLATVPHPLDGLRVVVDCAHGAAYDVAPTALRRAGAEVVAINAAPDGININDGVGSTHLDGLVDAVRAHAADVGIAHDGDADRCLAVDATGAVVDGDAILAICAVARHEERTLAHDTVVTTVMTNLGFRRAMDRHGITCVETPVGDRYVLEAMRAGGYTLGGEQSGHVVFGDLSPTGDGPLTALQLLSRVARTGATLAELAAVMQRMPQVLVNVPVRDRDAVGSEPSVAEAVARAESELGGAGRVLVRPSGTEALVRVMVEAATQEQAERAATSIADVVRATLGPEQG